MILIDYPGHFVAALLLAGSAVIIFLAFRSTELLRPALKPRRWLLMLLQYAVAVVLLVILWNPSRPKVGQTFSRNSVAVLFDTSESMSVVEEASTSRLDKAISLFNKTFRPADAKGPEYRIFGFDRQAYYSGNVGLLKRWGTETNLHDAVSLLHKYDAEAEPDPAEGVPPEGNADTAGAPQKDSKIDQGKVAGAIVFTDGQAEDKNLDTYLPLDRSDFPVVLVGVGSKEPQRDVAVKSISAPPRVAVDTAYPVRVAVTARGLQNQPVTIELVMDDRVVDSNQLVPGQFQQRTGRTSQRVLEPEEAVVEFTVAAVMLGSHALSARVMPLNKELNTANNQRSTVVHVVEEHKLKVLLYSQVANFDVGKIRQALARDSKIQLDVGLDAIRTPGLSDRAMQTCGYVRLPDKREGFYGYDIIILGPCDLSRLTQSQIDGLYSFVVDRGGGLILLPGREDFGPAAWPDEKARILIPALFDANRARKRTESPGPLELTSEGLSRKLLYPSDLTDQETQISAYYSTFQIKPAASTLASVGSTPAVSVHRVGRGRVCLLNLSRFFLLYREDRQGGLLYKLISGLTSHVGQVAHVEAGVKLFAERASDLSDSITFSAYVCDKSFAPVSSANVLLHTRDEVLSMEPIGRGYYRAAIGNLEDETIVATAQAEVHGTFLGETTIAVNLPAVQSEMTDIELDEQFLRGLAQRLKGKYLHTDDLQKDAARLFEARVQTGSVTRVTSIWPTWLLLLILCLLLSINWYVRRAIGLV